MLLNSTPACFAIQKRWLPPPRLNSSMAIPDFNGIAGRSSGFRTTFGAKLISELGVLICGSKKLRLPDSRTPST